MTRLARPGGSPPTPRSVDVARLAGVSQKTVSRVLNDEPYVSADVRRRVLDAAEELGYRRNQAARALASGRTRSIGVVTLGTALYGPASLLMGIERAVREMGYTLRCGQHDRGRPGRHRGRPGVAAGPGRGRRRHLRADRRGRRPHQRRRAGPGPRRAAAPSPRRRW